MNQFSHSSVPYLLVYSCPTGWCAVPVPSLVRRRHVHGNGETGFYRPTDLLVKPYINYQGPEACHMISGEGRLVRHGPDLGPCPNGTT
jgi:hypothetical protein